MKNRKVYVTTFCGVAVAMNIVLGIITSALGIPLYLDTLGTVLSAAILGPLPGIIVGALSNIITGLIYSVSDIPFCLVNMAVGLIVGLVAKKWKFGIVPAVITGIALSFICPGDWNTNRNLCIWRTEWISFGYAGDVTGAGWKNNFSGFLPQKCCVKLNR